MSILIFFEKERNEIFGIALAAFIKCSRAFLLSLTSGVNVACIVRTQIVEGLMPGGRVVNREDIVIYTLWSTFRTPRPTFGWADS